jgi:hypothetical protein
VGGVSPRRGEGGYILLDALIALFILVGGYTTCMGGIALAGRLAAREEARVIRTIEERNAKALAPALFAREK